MKFSMDQTYPDDGSTTISLNFNFAFTEFVKAKLPPRCGKCPVGYRYNGEGEDHLSCGVVLPSTAETDSHRPDSCKLKSISRYIQEIGIDGLIELISELNKEERFKGGYHYEKE